MKRLGILLTAASLLLSACAATPTATTGKTPGASAAGGTPSGDAAAVVAELYGIAPFAMRATGSYATFFVGRGCDEVRRRLRAGQWRFADLSSFYPGLAVLGQGSRHAMLQLTGDAHSCEVRLTTAIDEPLSVSGATNIQGTTSYLSWRCGTLTSSTSSAAPATPGATTAGDASVIAFLDGPGDVHLMIGVSFDPTKTTSPVSSQGDGDVTVVIAHGEASAAELFSQLMAASQGNPDATPPPGDSQYWPGDSFTGTVTLTSKKPLAGTITLKGLADDSGNSVDVTSGFRCDESG